jgi:hypothetical protein
MLDIFSDDYPDFTEFGVAPCAESFPDAFFSDEPLNGALVRRAKYTYEYEAKKICFECPYRARCLQYALKNPDLQGIWGGTTEKDRLKINRGVPVNLGMPSKPHR